jgi:integrase
MVAQLTSANQNDAILQSRRRNSRLTCAGEGIRADRERALLTIAYDTMARRAELVALDIDDFTFLPDGTGRVLIRRSKTDQAGEGNTGVFGARDCATAADLARSRPYRRRSGVSAMGGAGEDWREVGGQFSCGDF